MIFVFEALLTNLLIVHFTLDEFLCEFNIHGTNNFTKLIITYSIMYKAALLLLKAEPRRQEGGITLEPILSIVK